MRIVVAGARRRMSVAAVSGRPVYVAGQGVVPVERKVQRSLRDMGGEAIKRAVAEASIDPASVQGLYVGNMLAGMLSKQQHIGALLVTSGGCAILSIPPSSQ